MMAGRGDDIRVRQMPVDGTFPSGTAAFEKRNVVGHRRGVGSGPVRAVRPVRLRLSPQRHPRQVLRRAQARRGAPDLQVGADQRARLSRRSLHAAALRRGLHRLRHLRRGLPRAQPARSGHARPSTSRPRRPSWSKSAPTSPSSRRLPMNDRARVDFANVRGVQFLQPLFEFSGACAGCGETPYLKLLSQLFGDRLQIANATGCSSIYGGNLPVTPWTKDEAGRGPAWSNSLFEDNAEFGLGFRLAADKHLELARTLLAPAGAEGRGGAGSFDPRGAAGARVGAARPAIPGRGAQAEARDHRRRDRPRSALGGRSPDPAQHLDRGRRRLGLRHRLRRARSRPRQLARRQRAGARHRGLLQHRRSGFQGDAAGRGREVRGRRQAGGAQGSGAAGDRVRQRLRRAGGDGREPAAHAARVSRGGGLSGARADPRLQPLHRPRLRPATRHEATGPGGRQRSLAAVPLQSGHAHRGRAPLPAGLAAADDPAQGLRLQGAALPHARADRSRGGAGAAGGGAADRDREVPAVRGAGQPRRRDLQSGRHRIETGVGRRRDTANDGAPHGSDHQVHGPHPAKPADRVGLAAQP